MTRLSKLLIVWLGIVLVLAACSTTEAEPIAESREAGEDIVMETAVSTNEAQPVPPTAQPTAVQSPTPELIKADYPNLGLAPEIENEVWVNTDTPITLASQRGKVVLVEFWTFG